MKTWLNLALILALPGCGGGKLREPSPRWSRVDSAGHGTISIPPGWYVTVTGEPRFRLYAQDPNLAVQIVIVRQGASDESMAAAALRVARDFGAPNDFALVERTDGSLDGEVEVAPGRIVAACGVPATQERMVLAVTHRGSLVSVDREAYQAEGGLRLLCSIATSVRLRDS